MRSDLGSTRKTKLHIDTQKNQVHDQPAHKVIFLPCIFVPDGDVNETALFIIQVEVKLLSPLGV